MVIRGSAGECTCWCGFCLWHFLICLWMFGDSDLGLAKLSLYFADVTTCTGYHLKFTTEIIFYQRVSLFVSINFFFNNDKIIFMIF